MTEPDFRCEVVTEFNDQEIEGIERLLPQIARNSVVVPQEHRRLLREDKNTKIAVVYDGEKMAAMGTLLIVTMLTGRRSRLEQLVVDEAYRGKGLGRLLSTYIIDLAKKEGCTDVRFTSGKDRTASHNLYTSMGFESSDKVGYYKKLQD